MIVYLNGKILNLEDAVISPFDRAFQFGDGVYEVIRYYPDKFFEFGLHLERLKNSLNKLEIEFTSFENIEQTLYTLIKKNNLSGKISIAYIQISRGNQIPRRHVYSDSLNPTIFMYVEEYPRKIEDMNRGLKIGLEEDIRWMHCDIKATSLLPNILARHRAIKNGLSEIVWHRNGFITEGTQTNICFVKDGEIFTPPLSNFILPGITRKVVRRLCDDLGINFLEREINIDELDSFDEILLLSTSAEVTPVKEIDEKYLNGKVPGPICKLLQNEYQKLF